MDIGDTVQVLCSKNNGLTKEMVCIEWNEDYNMKSHLSLHQLIEELWLERAQCAVRLFNASKFRLHKIEVEKVLDVPTNLKMLLGTTSYKDFIGTNCASFAEKLESDGILDHSDRQSYLSNPVGVGGILETEDKDLVFMRRSSVCAEWPGFIDRPGGHPEPEEVISNPDSSKKQQVDSSKVVDEIFDSVLREIRDEINVPMEKMSAPLLLGISYNPKTWRRPSLEFYVRCCLPTKDVLDLYSKQTQTESEESTDLVIIPLSQALDYENFQKCDLYEQFTHAAQSAIYFLQIFHSDS